MENKYHITAWHWHDDSWHDYDAGEANDLDGARNVAEAYYKESKSKPYSMSISHNGEIWKWKYKQGWEKQIK